MLEKSDPQNSGRIPTGNSVLDTLFGQALAKQGALTQ